MVAAAIVGAAVVGAAGSAAAGNAQRSAARRATNAQVDSTERALQLDQAIYEDQRNLLAPSARAGAEARARQMLMLGYTPDQVKTYLREQIGAIDQPFGVETGWSGVPLDEWHNPNSPYHSPTGGGPTTIDLSPDEYSWVDEFDPDSFLRATPGYQFRLGEGQKALERSAAANGDLFSGQTGIRLNEYGQEYASDEWGKLFGQYGAIAGDGAESVDTVVQVGGQFGDSAGANIRAGGNARASGYRAIGDATANEYQGYADAIGGALGAWGSYGGFTRPNTTYGSGRSGSGWYG